MKIHKKNWEGGVGSGGGVGLGGVGLGGVGLGGGVGLVGGSGWM